MHYFNEDELFVLPEPEEFVYIKQASKADEILLVLVSGDDRSDESIQLLSKICGAMGYDFESAVTVLNMDTFKNISFTQLTEIGKQNIIISFGLHEPQFQTQFHKIKYLWTKLNDKEILFSDTLKEIGSNQALKVMLWKSLKERFDK